MEKHKSEI